jgi:hypothetical protein
LHISRPDDVLVTHGVAVLDATLEGDGDRLKAAMRMLTDAQALRR